MRVAHPAAWPITRLLTHATASAALLAVAAVSARPIPAQMHTVSAIGQQIGQTVSLGLDAGASQVSYDDYETSRVASVTPSVRWETARTMVVANASLSQFESGHTSLQSGVAGSLLSPEFLNMRAEAYGTFSNTRYLSSLAATNVYGVGRLHFVGTGIGAWVGAGGGFVSQNSGLPRSVAQLDGGLWARDDGVQYTLTVLPTRVGPWNYTDVTGAVRWEGTHGELSVTTGYRAHPSDSVPGLQAWAEAWLTVWLGRRVAFVTGAGMFPFDAVQGLPGGRYASAGLRLVTRRPPVSDPALRAELTEPYELRRLERAARGRVAIERFQVRDNADGSRELHLRVAGAKHVELMADFTDWAPVPLARTSTADEWATTVVIGRGVHRVNVRVDDREWEVPDGLTAVRDEFGGAVGILVVR
ncbi:MAG TPA: glycogen-binding domain-containing protein [Gemmatirosa sp.]